MQKLWEVQPQGLVLVLHPGQVQLCNCNNLKVVESTNWIVSIGDLPVGAGVAMATPDKERNLSTRNQNVMNKELFTIMKTVHDA